MSGIAGVLKAKRTEFIHGVLDRISHRGDTPAKVISGRQATFGLIQLARIEREDRLLSAADGEQAVVLDGWFSNLDQLQKDVLPGQSAELMQTEVFLGLYRELGVKVFNVIEGEYALAILDGSRVILARDRLGIRPLYYGFREGVLIFASEMKALAGEVDRIREFPPGHYFIADQGLFPYEPFLPEPIRLNGALDSAETLGRLLPRAAAERLDGNNLCGVWLSGGVDSSVVAALIRPYIDTLYTFSAGMEGGSDLEYARIVARHLGTKHYERIYTMRDVERVIENVVYMLESYDAPLVRSAISNYLVAELAAEHVPFVFSGEGGDELFAGYAYQKDYQGDVELTLSIQEAITALHNTALQRVDRSAAAHGTYAAVPFLHADIVRFALTIPAIWKIRGEEAVDKWPLRRAMEGTLPDEVIWRAKAKFWEGAGSAQQISDYAASQVSDKEWMEALETANGNGPRSKEEMFYYRVFQDHFKGSVHPQDMGMTEHVQL